MTGSQGMPPPPTPWMAIGTVVVLTTVATGLAAYIWIRTHRAPTKDVAIVPKVQKPTQTPLSALAVEQRENGVKALRAGEYALAIASFETALKLDADVPDVAVLLDVARRLRDADAVDTAPAAVSPPPLPPRESERPQRPERRPQRSSRSRTTKPPPPKPPKLASLLVVTTPERILIELDGRTVELSPARLELEPGKHRVRLRRG
ncbi:MAG: hypothetical protein AAF449_03035, partial [Myxococcota bacterium]